MINLDIEVHCHIFAESYDYMEAKSDNIQPDKINKRRSFQGISGQHCGGYQPVLWMMFSTVERYHTLLWEWDTTIIVQDVQYCGGEA